MTWFQAGLFFILIGMHMGLRADVLRLRKHPAGWTDTYGLICIWAGVLCIVFSAFTGK